MVYDLIKYHDSAVNYCKRPADDLLKKIHSDNC